MTPLVEPGAIEVVVPAMSREGAPLDLPATLAIPDDAHGIVVFAHGSGSGRGSPRNRLVAGVLHEGGLATLLVDLLTPEEAGERANVFDIDFLAERLWNAVRFALGRERTAGLPLGLFGASTGAAAALIAAAQSPQRVRAVVSRGGRPDLAENWLHRVTAPTLLIVGGNDIDVLRLNEWAAEQIAGFHRVEVVPHATHLFEEPGTLDQAAALARNWFQHYVHANAAWEKAG